MVPCLPIFVGFKHAMAGLGAEVCCTCAADVAHSHGQKCVLGQGQLRSDMRNFCCAGARVTISEIDPICALQATMEGYSVAPLEDVLETADIFITTTGNKDIIMAQHLSKMKNNAIVGNIGHFDNEIDMAGIIGWPGEHPCSPILERAIKHPASSKCDITLYDGHLSWPIVRLTTTIADA